MKAVVFGIHGQDGYYLNNILQKNNVQVIGVSRSEGNWVRGDVSNRTFVEELIRNHQPDYVFHLAANSTTRHDALFENHETISTGTLNILEAVYRYSPGTKVFLSGSAMQFENKGLPIDEQTPLSASSPYAVARIQSVYAGRYYRNLGINVYVGYFFNHDSPLRPERHVNQKIAIAAKGFTCGRQDKLELGNIDVQKEFTFAGDVMKAIWILVNQSDVFEAVIGSGQAYSIKDWLDCCFKKTNKDWRDYVIIKKDFIPEYKILVSNPKLIKSLGWQPEVSFIQLANLMMEDK
ncbi:MAG TPA: GDP-mannose 4,6-dehydratase [Bacteroidales bacterium]|nr:GDP-mannose 4,6-dehydratase [Bacteroidales bacterium]